MFSVPDTSESYAVLLAVQKAVGMKLSHFCILWALLVIILRSVLLCRFPSGVFRSAMSNTARSFTKTVLNPGLRSFGKTSFRLKNAARWTKVNSKYKIKVSGRVRKIDPSKLR